MSYIMLPLCKEYYICFAIVSTKASRDNMVPFRISEFNVSAPLRTFYKAIINGQIVHITIYLHCFNVEK